MGEFPEGFCKRLLWFESQRKLSRNLLRKNTPDPPPPPALTMYSAYLLGHAIMKKSAFARERTAVLCAGNVNNISTGRLKFYTVNFDKMSYHNKLL